MNRTPPSPALDIQGVTRTFGRGDSVVTAVKDVSLTIPTGQIVALLGHNGAGKTTLLDMVLGLGDPSRGALRVLGMEPARAVSSGRISALLQTGGLLHDLTVIETVRTIAGLHGALGRMPEVIERTGLAPLLKRRVGKCSGGEQQRLKFALALLPDPDVLILDEPTAGMDAAARRTFWATMRTDADAGRTIVFATHYLEEAQDFAERTVVMSRGRVVADDSTAALRGAISGRTLAVTVEDAATAAQRLQDRPEVRDVEREGSRLTLTSADSDITARALLDLPGARDLEITAPTLENAYLALSEQQTEEVSA